MIYEQCRLELNLCLGWRLGRLEAGSGVYLFLMHDEFKTSDYSPKFANEASDMTLKQEFR
jgi:hypothetical protein